MSGSTPQQVYDAIKQLEQQNKLPFPNTQAHVSVGTFNAATGKFTFSTPTIMATQINVIGGKPRPTQFEVGRISTAPVFNLFLEFRVLNPKGPLTVEVGGVSATAAEGQTTVTVNVGRFKTDPAQTGIASTALASVSSGTASTEIHLAIIRAPLTAAGAFTIPVVPIALVYAPPPGPQNKNYAEYSNMTSVSSKISTAVSSGNSTKTATAYSTSDFVGKITGAIGALKTFAASLVTAGAASAEDAKQDAQDANDTSDMLSSFITLVAAFLPDQTTSTTNSLTTTSEHDIQTTDADTATQGSTPGLGPGVGDRFVYVRDVRVAWLITDDVLSVTLVGDDGIRAFPAQDLQGDLQAISGVLSTGITGVDSQDLLQRKRLIGPFGASVGPKTNLDGASIRSLLQLDPFVGATQPVLDPVLAPPRYVPNDPSGFAGSGGDVNGDSFKVFHDLTTTDIATQVTTTTDISDYKPGWLQALFGENVATEGQLTFTYTGIAQTVQDQQQTATVTFFTGPDDPTFAVGLYFDRMFRTFAFTPPPPV